MIIHSEYGELDYFKAFLGNCYGVALSGRTGDWVKFSIIVEDDEHWHVSRNGGGSTYWFPDLENQIRDARQWMDLNLVKGEWGYIVP